MHFSAFVVAAFLPYAAADASVQAGGAGCPQTCYGVSCLSAAALWADAPAAADNCAALESWGCDCGGCDCTDTLDLDTIDDVPDDYSCGSGEAGQYGGGGLNCDEMAYFGYSCHYMETRRATDCSGCLCEEEILNYATGDESCPQSCLGSNCDLQVDKYTYSCEGLETLDWVAGCDCSGCDCASDDGHPAATYHGMDCNGNGYWGNEKLGNEECDEELASFSMLMGNPSDGYAEQTWFTCLSCEEMQCDMGDCGEEACGRDGTTCALPLCELCADEDSQVSPTQFGRSVYCTEGSYTCAPSPAPTTAAPTVTSTEATVAAEEDGSFVLTTTAAFTIALLLA